MTSQITSHDKQRKTLRQQGRNARRSLSPQQRRAGTQQINRRLVNRLRRYQRIALYWHFDGEPDLFNSLVALLRLGKTIYLPLINQRGAMEFIHSRTLNKARVNRYGIIEPGRHGARISSKRLQAIVVPLTAYDANGHRLGMGAGFYDKNLGWQTKRKTWRGPSLIGCAWRCQAAETIPAETWDRTLNALANEQHLLTFRKQP